jgi:hypothetical protein
MKTGSVTAPEFQFKLAHLNCRELDRALDLGTHNQNGEGLTPHNPHD